MQNVNKNVVATTFNNTACCFQQHLLYFPLRCWLIFGMGQRLRFYPEYAVWIIPHLFVRSTTISMYKVVQKLYGEHYKHGWRVDLDDEIFNKYYHIITGYEHVSNNYNRDEVKDQKLVQKSLRDEMEGSLKYDISDLMHYVENQAFDSEAILYDALLEKKQLDVDYSNIANQLHSQPATLRRLKFLIFRFQSLHHDTK